jgi:hypothetical protein
MKMISILVTLLLSSILSEAQFKYLKGTLQASQVGGTVNSNGSGVVIVRYNTVTRLLEHFGNYRGLTATITNQHIHTGAPGVSGPVTIPLAGTGGTSGGLTGSQVLTVAQETDLLAGNMYTNIHTSTYPSGEIRGQLTQTTDGQTEFLNARLQGAQSTPPNPSLATGNANVLIDKATHTLYLTSTYTGLTTAANNAHIHVGAPGASGAVIIPLIFVTGTSGTLDTSRVITTTDEASILAGNTYVNVHTSTYPAGEIRGQLTKLSQIRYLANALQGSQQVPSNASTARGTVIVKYDTLSNFLELVGDYQDLSATISGSHIHGPFGPPGTNTAVLFNLTNSGGTTGTLTGTATLTQAQEVDLLAGNMYANVHSTGAFAGGEIRGQLLLTTAGETQYMVGNLQASQSVATPAVVSSGVGTATVLVDKTASKVYVTGSFSGLTSNITATHIHGGAAGGTGAVVVPLTFGGTTSGTVSGTATIRSTFADSMINGLTYLNIHTVNYGGGEIRAQLADLVLPVKLIYFNGYRNQNQVTLLWESAQESSLSQYEIEQQNVEAGNWITKTTVFARGGTAPTTYKTNDVPLIGKGNYAIYRLKMIDKDGRFSYSPIVRINFKDAKAELTILQNPVTNGELKYSITGLENNKALDVMVIDYNGKVVLKTSGQSFMNSKVNVSSLASGMYQLIIKSDELLLKQSFLK